MMFPNAMFLRPGNLWKEFRVLRSVVKNENGYPKRTYEDTGQIIRGILAQATASENDKNKHLWDQEQHSLSHTLVLNGVSDGRKIKKEDVLSFGEKAYLVLAIDDIGALGIAGLVYLEERNDLK